MIMPLTSRRSNNVYKRPEKVLQIRHVFRSIGAEVPGGGLVSGMDVVDTRPAAVHAGIYLRGYVCVSVSGGQFSPVRIHGNHSLEFFRGDGGKLCGHNKLIFSGDEKGVYTEVHTGAHAAVREYDKDVHKSWHMHYHHNSPANTDNLKYIDDNTHIHRVFCSHIRSGLAVCVYRSIRIGLKSCIDCYDEVSLLSVGGILRGRQVQRRTP